MPGYYKWLSENETQNFPDSRAEWNVNYKQDYLEWKISCPAFHEFSNIMNNTTKRMWRNLFLSDNNKSVSSEQVVFHFFTQVRLE